MRQALHQSWQPSSDRSIARSHLIFKNLAQALWQRLDRRTLAKIADIAQLVEREPSKLNVVGSRPTVRSISGVPGQHR